jgi:hypothetical protein
VLPFGVRVIVGKLCVATLLILCVGLYLLEMSGRWDQSIQDANDEAGFVAIVLCIGVALSVAGGVIASIRASRPTVHILVREWTTLSRQRDLLAARFASASSPPLPLRI